MSKKYENICKKENIKLTNLGLSNHSFGNVSIRVNHHAFFIKPSGIDVKNSKNMNFPLIDIKTGKVINKSKLKPSVDTPTHRKIYSKYKEIKSIAHCHSLYATAWAQASKSIPLLEINFISAAASNMSAVAPDVPPVISSPFTNGPFVDGLSNDKDVLVLGSKNALTRIFFGN